MKFFLAPDQYLDTQKVKPEWIRNLRTNISKELVKRQPYAHMMLEYITSTYMSPAAEDYQCSIYSSQMTMNPMNNSSRSLVLALSLEFSSLCSNLFVQISS